MRNKNNIGCFAMNPHTPEINLKPDKEVRIRETPFCTHQLVRESGRDITGRLVATNPPTGDAPHRHVELTPASCDL